MRDALALLEAEVRRAGRGRSPDEQRPHRGYYCRPPGRIAHLLGSDRSKLSDALTQRTVTPAVLSIPERRRTAPTLLRVPRVQIAAPTAFRVPRGSRRRHLPRASTRRIEE